MRMFQALPERLLLTFLPALVKIEPAVIVTELNDGGSASVNWRLATEALPVLKVIGRFTTVPAWPETLPPANVGLATDWIVSANVALPVPPALVALIETFELPLAVGVPEINPVVVLIDKPAGSPVALKLVGLLVAVIW